MIPGRHFAALQVQGARPYQEDDYGCVNDRDINDAYPSDLLLVLADGMGGHNGGAHAGRVAVKTFIDSFRTSSSGLVARLETALTRSNDQIRLDAEADPSLTGMGCTLAAVYFSADGIVWASVGDSPFWRWRDGVLQQLNEDHSMAPVIRQSVERGELSADQARNHPHRNALRSALTGDPIPQTDLRETPVPLRVGDKFIIASDGLQSLSDPEIASIMADDLDALTLTRRLIKAVEAKAVPGQDNTTVMVVTPYTDAETPPVLDWEI